MRMRRTRSRQGAGSPICSDALSASTYLLIHATPIAAATAFDPSLLLILALLLLLGALGVFMYYYGRKTTALRAIEARYREVFQSAGEGFYELTAEGGFIRANPALA